MIYFALALSLVLNVVCYVYIRKLEKKFDVKRGNK